MPGLLNFKSAAIAAGLALAALASPASATTTLVKLTNATMDGTFRSYINGGEVYSNGINFAIQEIVSGDTYDAFAFCVDIFHHIGLGPINLTYVSDKGPGASAPTTTFGPNAYPVGALARVTALADIGYELHNAGALGHSLQTAAIQSAIWATINPGVVSLRTDNLSAGDGAAYTAAYNYYRTTNDIFAADHRVYSLLPQDGSTQAFVVGWPIEVPEPGTWALMLVGFLGAGSALRSRRTRPA